MKFSDIVNRQNPPAPWVEGEKIPWNEPGFSKRMLKEHLSQDHNAASRRSEIIHRQVDYLERIAGGMEKDLKVLDIACGPGLHSHDFARRGHTTFGIDFSPASIEWAKSTAEEQSLQCEFTLGDVRATDFGTDIDLAMLLFGELNVYTTDDLKLIIRKARQALKAGGTLMLEPHEPGVIRTNFETKPSWSTHSGGGLFSESPHVLLEEGFWHEDVQMAVKRWYVVDTATSEVTLHSQTVVEYTRDELVVLIEAEGFTVSEAPGNWAAGNEDGPAEFYPLVAIAK
jgi:SAM-dependent methyltransferase